MFRNSCLFYCLICVAFLVACSSGDGDNNGNNNPPQNNQPPGLFAISGYYYSDPPPVDTADLIQRLEQVNALVQTAGVNGQVLTYTWSDLEPTVGNYDMTLVNQFIDGMTYAESQGYQQMFGMQIINTVAREVPAELQSTAWDDPTMVSALEDMLDVLLPHMDSSVNFLSIGNEVDVYFFNGREAELTAYKTLVDGAKDYVQNQNSDIKVGITVTAEGWFGSNIQSILDLTENNDAMIATYYPLNSNFTVKPANSPLADFPTLLAYRDNRPLVMQEVGYPSSTVINSSQAQQAEFFRNVFDAWIAADGGIELLNLFLLHDFSTDLVDTFVAYYGVNDPNFRAYLDSLGLRNSDNTDKAAWPVVIEEAAEAGF